MVGVTTVVQALPHLWFDMFEADSKGVGMTTVNNIRRRGKGAVAIVVRPSDALDNRIACTDFDF